MKTFENDKSRAVFRLSRRSCVSWINKGRFYSSYLDPMIQMQVLQTEVDILSEEFKAKKASMDNLIKDMESIHAKITDQINIPRRLK